MKLVRLGERYVNPEHVTQVVKDGEHTEVTLTTGEKVALPWRVEKVLSVLGQTELYAEAAKQFVQTYRGFGFQIKDAVVHATYFGTTFLEFRGYDPDLVWILTAHALGWESGTPCDRIRELDAQRRHDEHM